MPTKAVFRCQFCDATPDHGTQRSLQGQVSERMFGEYLDAFPGRWLVWNGGGPLGPRRYACRQHRGDLVAYLRYHYATVAAQVWKRPPYQQRWPDEKREHMGGSMGIIKFGLRGGLLQDAPPASAKKPDEPVPVEPAATDSPPPAPAPAPTPAAEASPLADALPPETRPAADPPLDDDESPASPEPDAGADLLVDELFPPGDLFVPDDLLSATDDAPGLPDGGAMWPEDEVWPGEEQWPPPGVPPDDGPEADPPPAA